MYLKYVVNPKICLHLRTGCMPNIKSYYYSSTNTFANHIFKSIFTHDQFHIEQLMNGSVAEYSYYISSDNQSLFIDPKGSMKKFNDIIQKEQKIVKGFFLTSFQNKYHLDMNLQIIAKLRYKIYMGPSNIENKLITILKEGYTLSVGRILVSFLSTPGCTQSSSCILLTDSSGNSRCLFTGHTLLINQIDLPNCAVSERTKLAEKLYSSLNKIMALDSSIIIYPGSKSNENKSIEQYAILKNSIQKISKIKNKQQFIKYILNYTNKKYFTYNPLLKKYNQFCYAKILKQINNKLTCKQLFNEIYNNNVILIDIRNRNSLQTGIIKGSLCFGEDGAFIQWFLTLIPPHVKCIFYSVNDNGPKIVNYFLMMGYINVIGYANFEISDWIGQKFPFFTLETVEQLKQDKNTIALDVRKPLQWLQGIPDGNTELIELSNLFNQVARKKLSSNEKYIVYCHAGYRATIAYSYLKKNDYNVKLYNKSFQTIKASHNIVIPKL